LFQDEIARHYVGTWTRIIIAHITLHYGKTDECVFNKLEKKTSDNFVESKPSADLLVMRGQEENS
jgi:hypothetical protein